MDGDYLLTLVRETRIEGIEEHIEFIYAARGERLLVLVGAIIAVALAGIIAAVLPVVQGGLTRDAATHDVWLAIVVGVGGVVTTGVMLSQISTLEPECRGAKDLAARLAEIYRDDG